LLDRVNTPIIVVCACRLKRVRWVSELSLRLDLTMPVRDRGARERFLRQGSFSAVPVPGGGLPWPSPVPGGGGLFHHHSGGASRRASAHDAAALRSRRRSTLRRQVAHDDLIAEEEETAVTLPDTTAAAETKPSGPARPLERRRASSSGGGGAQTTELVPDFSRLRARRQSTPVALPLRLDPEFNTSPSSRPGIRPTSRPSISAEDTAAGPSAPTTTSKYLRQLTYYILLLQIISIGLQHAEIKTRKKTIL